MTTKKKILLTELALGKTLMEAARISGYSDCAAAHRAAKQTDSIEFFREARELILKELTQRVADKIESGACSSGDMGRVIKYLTK